MAYADAKGGGTMKVIATLEKRLDVLEVELETMLIRLSPNRIVRVRPLAGVKLVIGGRLHTRPDT